MICLDTQVLIWGVQGQATPNAQEMVKRTANHIAHLEAQNARVIIPAPVVTEYLQGFEVEEQPRQLTTLQKNFVIPAFDIAAAALTAKLMRERQKEVSRQSNETRQSLKVDFMIAAIAIQQGATTLVTHNTGDFKGICGNRISVIDVPNVALQGGLGL